MASKEKEITLVMNIQVTKIIKIAPGSADEETANRAVDKAKAQMLKKIGTACDDVRVIKEKRFPNLEG